MIATEPPKLKFTVLRLERPIEKYQSFDHLVENVDIGRMAIAPKFFPSCKICGKTVQLHQMNKQCHERHSYIYNAVERRVEYSTTVHARHQITCNMIIRDSNGHHYTNDELLAMLPKTRRKHRRDWSTWDYQHRHVLARIKYTRGYHRHPQTMNEKRQLAAATVDYPVHVRKDRGYRTLPCSWDDLNISAYKYKGWKNCKVAKQWMINI